MSDVERHAGEVHRRDLARLVRLAVVAGLVVVVIAVALDNRGDVRLGYVVGDTTAPVWIAIVAAAVVGAVAGWLLRHRPRRRND
jgi:uncharacterized integral membrane protein